MGRVQQEFPGLTKSQLEEVEEALSKRAAA